MMLRIATYVVAMGLAVPAFAQDVPADWLAGQWCAAPDAEERMTCETWRVEGAALTGVSESRAPDGTAKLLERMRISAEPGRLVFHADPEGQEGGDFYATGAQPARGIRFENRAHDYPQVVRYWREGELLMAEISLADGGKAMRWTFRRAGN
ncbi:MAG: hypothetical protein EOP61_04165 [Sphingomonadales bacterium]|nr:MAG: hypothetical protein EOP61_04165 [Sphingomonadales bacterium]